MSSDDQINHEKRYVAGGHIEDRGQPSLPVAQRRLANGSPLGLLSFATDAECHDVLVFFGGVCQYIVSIMEFVAGNTFGATVFASYAAFNVSYSMIYLPGSGIIAAYTAPKTGALSPDFQQAIALYLWAWFILTIIYTIAAVITTWVLFLDLFTLDICLALLAVGNMMGHQATITAGYTFGYLVAALSYWAGCAGLFGDGLTPFNVPTFPLHKIA